MGVKHTLRCSMSVPTSFSFHLRVALGRHRATFGRCRDKTTPMMALSSAVLWLLEAAASMSSGGDDVRCGGNSSSEAATPAAHPTLSIPAACRRRSSTCMVLGLPLPPVGSPVSLTTMSVASVSGVATGSGFRVGPSPKAVGSVGVDDCGNSGPSQEFVALGGAVPPRGRARADRRLERHLEHIQAYAATRRTRRF